MAKLGDYIREECHPLGSLGAQELRLIGVSNEHGLHASSRDTSADLARYQRIEKNWFAYNPMRVNVGSIGLADDESKTGFTSPDYTVFSCREGLDPHYLLHFLKSDYGLEAIARNCSGAVRKRLYYSGLAEIDLPVPGMEDQLAFVSRINHISDTIRFIREENSDRHELPLLKQAILQEAIQGKLTADWRAAHPDVEPASQLLHRIQAEKARLIAAKKIKAGGKQQAVDDDENELILPPEWEFPHLDEVSMFVTDGTHQTPTYTTTGKPFLSAQNVKPFRFIPVPHKLVSQYAFNDYTKNRFPEKGDLLVGRVGSVGEAAVIDSDLEFAFYVSVGLVKTFKTHTVPQYLAIVFNSPYGVRYARGNTSSKGASAGNFNLGRIRSFPIPLPPFAEQAAIVERVEALMTTCRALEAEIEHARTHAAHLLQAVLKVAFAPAAA